MHFFFRVIFRFLTTYRFGLHLECIVFLNVSFRRQIPKHRTKQSHTPSLRPVFQQHISSEETRHNFTFSNKAVLTTDRLFLDPRKSQWMWLCQVLRIWQRDSAFAESRTLNYKKKISATSIWVKHMKWRFTLSYFLVLLVQNPKACRNRILI